MLESSKLWKKQVRFISFFTIMLRFFIPVLLDSNEEMAYKLPRVSCSSVVERSTCVRKVIGSGILLGELGIIFPSTVTSRLADTPLLRTPAIMDEIQPFTRLKLLRFY